MWCAAPTWATRHSSIQPAPDPTPKEIRIKIAEIKVHFFHPTPAIYQWKEEWAPRSLNHILLRVITDDGLEGHCLSYLLSPMELRGALPGLRNTLIGRDPHEVEAISYELTDRMERPTPVASAIDICLWDLIGKAHNEPIYRLLGVARTRIRAYASTFMCPTDEDYVKLALQCRDQGFTAFKIHPYGVARRDIETCRAVRKAVGDSMELMLDPVNSYTRREAATVAAALEELDFYWFEAPIPDSDIDGLRDLTRSFRIPIAGAEYVNLGIKAYPQYLNNPACDIMRGIGDWIGGISALRKAAAMCEGHGVNFEPHSYGTVHIQAAHLHVMLSIHNCEFVELPVPLHCLDIGMQDTITIDKDGYVNAPTKPGLGYNVDWAQIEKHTAELVSVTADASGGERGKGRASSWT